jgi:DNA helicase-2/ATP-dependent DNA helicase PcrA
LGDDDAIEEERRVLYVALTRAKDELYITRTLSSGYSRVSWNATAGSHYFLEDVPSQLVEWDNRVVTSYRYFDEDDDVIG